MPLSAPVTALALERETGRYGDAAVAAMQGVRVHFEDAHLLDLDAGLFAVCDGHLGDEAAAFCAERLAAHVTAQAGKAAATVEESLVDAFVACDQELRDTLPVGCKAGSTVTLARVSREAGDAFRISVANCGDSRAILWHTEDGSFEETRDHRPSDPDEKHRIEAAGGMVCEDFDPPRIDGELACSRALGAFKYKQDSVLGPGAQKVSVIPDVYDWKARVGDILLLGCDGIFDTLYNKQVVEIISKASPDGNLGEAVAAVLKLCIDKDADDNLTLLAVRLGEMPSVTRTTEVTAGNFLKTKDKEVLEQYETFCLRYGFALKKEMVPKRPPISSLTETPAIPGLRFSHLLPPAAPSAPAARAVSSLPVDDAMEMKVTARKPASFYRRSAVAFLRGVEAKEGGDAKAPVEALRISATGAAVATAVEVASLCEADNVACVAGIATAYLELYGGRGCAQIVITLTRK